MLANFYEQNLLLQDTDRWLLEKMAARKTDQQLTTVNAKYREVIQIHFGDLSVPFQEHAFSK